MELRLQSQIDEWMAVMAAKMVQIRSNMQRTSSRRGKEQVAETKSDEETKYDLVFFSCFYFFVRT